MTIVITGVCRYNLALDGELVELYAGDPLPDSTPTEMVDALVAAGIAGPA